MAVDILPTSALAPGVMNPSAAYPAGIYCLLA